MYKCIKYTVFGFVNINSLCNIFALFRKRKLSTNYAFLFQILLYSASFLPTLFMFVLVENKHFNRNLYTSNFYQNTKFNY